MQLVAAYLKEVMPIGPVEFAAQHAAALEIYGQIRTDKDHFDRVSLEAPYGHPRRDRRVSHEFPTGSPFSVCY
jgi:hypothetical protein